MLKGSQANAMQTFDGCSAFLIAVFFQMGSCSGITVLSLRSNNLTYIPDEVGRIPHLRVLNLSDNKLRFLPFSFMRLKELQALWLAENQVLDCTVLSIIKESVQSWNQYCHKPDLYFQQTKPLIRLQRELDPETGQRTLTCYLLPQQRNNDREGKAFTEMTNPSGYLWPLCRDCQLSMQFKNL